MSGHEHITSTSQPSDGITHFNLQMQPEAADGFDLKVILSQGLIVKSSMEIS